jgi:hypothetical protein
LYNICLVKINILNEKRKYNKKGGAESDESVLNIGDRNIFDDIEDLGPVYGPDIDSLTGDDDGWNTDDSDELRFPFYESIIKAVKYSMGENRLIHPPKE